jgi:hypothetical protein
VYHTADLPDPAQFCALIEVTTHIHGTPDILVANAVVHYFGAVDFAPQRWDADAGGQFLGAALPIDGGKPKFT